MDDDRDDSDGEEDGRAQPPSVSRLDRGGDRRYRVVNRATGRYRGRFRRLGKQLPIEELVGRLIRHHGLTDEVRKRFVCLYWPEIAGERIASKTFPVSFADGVLQVSAISSPWVHEMQFFKTPLIAEINGWIDSNRVWLGPPPLVTDMRFVLAMREREPLVDREHARRLRLHRLHRMRPRVDATPPIVSDADREAIRAETRSVVDPELRAVIESVRMKWNR